MTYSSANAFKELPRDIASVVSHGQTYIFFVNSNHQLCYLKSPQDGTKDFEHYVVRVSNGSLRVKCGTRQVAAMAWKGPNNDHEIRIYCVAPEDGKCSKRGYIQEVAYNMNGWELGTLGQDNPKAWIDSEASLSASAFVWPDKADLTLFVSEKDDVGRPMVAKYVYDYATDGGTWVEDGIISCKVSDW